MPITREFIEQKFNIDRVHNFETWFMGTNEFDIWKNIILSIKSRFGANDWNSIMNSDSIHMSCVGQNRYEFKIGNFNILDNQISSRPNDGYLAESTLHQYIDFGIALRFINEERSKKHKFDYQLYPNFINFINNVDEENLNRVFLDKILTLLRTYFYSNNDKVRSIGCSISWAIIYNKCFTENNEWRELVSQKIIELKKKDNKDNGMIQFIGAYNSLVEQLVHEFGFEFLLNIVETNLNLIANIEIEPIFRFDEVARLVQNYRSQLRQEIIASRVRTKTWYSDFNQPVDERYIDDLQACHIKEVNQINSELRNHNLSDEDRQNLLNELNDDNNGILLNRDSHFLFDDRLFEIDPRNGKIIIENNEKSKKRVCQAFGVSLNECDNIYLKETTLTNEMRNYIRQRN